MALLKRFLRLGFFFAAVFLLSHQAIAHTAADREKARTLMAKGDAAFEHKDYPAALEAYTAAHTLMGVPTTGIATAKTLAELGRLIEARELAMLVTRMSVTPREPAAFTTARTAAGRLAEDLEGRIPTLAIAITGASPEVADVTLDGKPLGARAVGKPRKLDPGKHTVTAIAVGFQNTSADVDLTERAKETVTLELVPIPPAAPAASATAPIAESKPEADREAPKSRVSPLVYIGFGVGAAGLITGTVTGVMSLSATSAAKEHCQGNLCQPAAQDDIDSAMLLANVANVGFGVGVLGVGLGVVGLFMSGGSAAPPPNTGVRVEPVFGSRFVGARGSF